MAEKQLPMPHEGGSYIRDPESGRLVKTLEREWAAEIDAPAAPLLPAEPASKGKAKAKAASGELPAAEKPASAEASADRKE